MALTKVGGDNFKQPLAIPSGLTVAGVVTATTFSGSFTGALTGTATSTTNIPNLTGAITSSNTTTSLGSFSSSNLATALTDETGSGAAVFATSPTLSTVTVSSGGINVTGVSTFSGGIQGNVTGNVNSSGVSTFSSVNVTGNVSIGGTLTYDDVTNVDSIGLVTARSGVRIDAGGLVVTAGVSTFTTGPVIIGAATSTGTASQPLQVTGGAYVSGNIGIGLTNPQNSLHINGATPAIRFSDTDANGSAFSIIEDNNGLLKVGNDAGNSGTGSGIAFEVDGSERLRITSSGLIGIGGNGTGSGLGVYLQRSSPATTHFYEASDGTKKMISGVDSTNDYVKIGSLSSHRVGLVANNAEKISILPSGNIGIGTNNPTSKLQVVGSTDLNKLNLSGISFSISSTATDVFVYDTRKDSDGGAWRKRTQHTSWYNETLNTATRGSRKDFPAVAVIVSEEEKVTIYDGDDPDMPMWMVFQGVVGSWKFAQYGDDSAVMAVYALNGILCVGNTGTTYGSLHILNFIKETAYAYIPSLFQFGGNFVNRNDLGGPLKQVIGAPSIVDAKINDVAMTVLPNAPIDPSTGLPVPTIAVATAGGVSVIRDDGSVESTDNAIIIKIGFVKNDRLAYGHRGNQEYAGRSVNIAPFRNSLAYGFFQSNTIPHFGNSDLDAGNILGVGDGNVYGYGGRGIRRIFEDEQNRNNGMANYITRTYNTGWMHGDIKGAWLSDTSTASVTGTALLTGQASTYSVDTSNGGWTSQPSATNAYNATNGVGGSGCIRLTSSGSSNVWNSLSLGTVISGAKYSITFSAKIASSVTTTFTVSQFQFNGTSYGSIAPTVTTSHVTYSFIFTASSTTAWFNVFAGNGTGSALDVDNIDVRLLAEPDRSVNNKGLAVYGTITKTAVATGSNLVAYSGFSASNYLVQPYNSALDFGTGDFSVMCWAYRTVNATRILIDKSLQNSTQTNRFVLYFDNSAGYVIAYDGSSAVVCTSNTVLPLNVWTHIVFVRRSSVGYLYMNGNLVATQTGFSGNFSNSSHQLVIGNGYDFTTYLWGGSLSLVRISSSAPSPEQIKKIYEDEKVLFQEGAQATLYGASDAVTALAYDDTTKLLSVGTSSGRSDFQGLRRINNTTTAVTTAISASNGLIAEQ